MMFELHERYPGCGHSGKNTTHVPRNTLFFFWKLADSSEYNAPPPYRCLCDTGFLLRDIVILFILAAHADRFRDQYQPRPFALTGLHRLYCRDSKYVFISCSLQGHSTQCTSILGVRLSSSDTSHCTTPSIPSIWITAPRNCQNPSLSPPLHTTRIIVQFIQ